MPVPPRAFRDAGQHALDPAVALDTPIDPSPLGRKAFCDQQLLDAVQQAIDRDPAARRQWAGLAGLRRRYESLTQREREVMTLVVTGLLNKQFAAQLPTSEGTVKAHRAQLTRKMEADSVAQLVRIAEALSLLPPRH